MNDNKIIHLLVNNDEMFMLRYSTIIKAKMSVEAYKETQMEEIEQDSGQCSELRRRDASNILMHMSKLSR